MSSINSISSTGLSQFFQNISAAGQTNTAQPSQVSSTDPSTDPTSTGQAVQGTGHHKHHGGGGKFKQIEQAVTNALQSAQSTSADGSPTDVNQTIQDAISKVLNSNATGNPAGTDPTTNPTATTQTSPTTGPESVQDFLQTLGAAGVDPQQFRQDFLAAVQNSTGGQANPTGSSSLLPPGTFVDVEG